MLRCSDWPMMQKDRGCQDSLVEESLSKTLLSTYQKRPTPLPLVSPALASANPDWAETHSHSSWSWIPASFSSFGFSSWRCKLGRRGTFQTWHFTCLCKVPCVKMKNMFTSEPCEVLRRWLGRRRQRRLRPLEKDVAPNFLWKVCTKLARKTITLEHTKGGAQKVLQFVYST